MSSCRGTRRERADRLKKDRKDFFKYAREARCILEELLEKYAQHGAAQFVIPEILDPPLSEHVNVLEIADKSGGVEKLREAIAELQTLLYAAAQTLDPCQPEPTTFRRPLPACLAGERVL